MSSVASLMVALDVLVVSTALGVIRQRLGASIGELESTVNAHGLSFAVLLITACALGDRLRRRRLFAGGLGLFVLASAACALAPNAGLLTAARSGMAYEAMIAPLVLAGAGISMAIRPAGMRWSARCRQPSSARPQPRRPIHRGAPPTLG